MARIQGVRPFCQCVLSLYLLIVVAGASPNLGRSSFPEGFKFGVGSSAYQDEGGTAESGRGLHIWDTFAHIPGNIIDGKNGDVALDQYNRFKEDIQLLKYMGMDIYRFSISWSHIYPKGSPRHGDVNEQGFAYYNNLINELIKNGMEPLATLYHWDMPQVLEDEYGGFLSKKVVEDFVIFAEECFRAFGDRVKYWTTVNEPLTFAMYGYDLGLHAPGRCSSAFGNCTSGDSATEPYIATHNMLLAHSAAVKIYRTKYQGTQKGFIGMAIVVNWMVPYSDSLLDQEATQRAIDFRIGWYMDPLTFGKYPDSMQRLVGARLPKFSSEEAKDLKGSFDYIGFNYYSTDFTVNNPIPQNFLPTDYVLDPQAKLSYEVNGVYIGSNEGVSAFRSYPVGLRDVLNYTKHHYNNPPIFITETGYGDYDNDTTPLDDALHDLRRVKYHYQHLKYLLEAIREGSDVRGYVVWSFLDGFEWSSGYTFRFGLYHVDYNDNLKRYAKLSADWFKHILKL